MTKTYFNNAIIGNSSMLGCITDKGELVRLFWPNIDYPQHIDRFYCGVFQPGEAYSTRWLHEDSFNRKQYYMKDTNILVTVYQAENSLRITSTEFVIPDMDVMVRSYEMQNDSGNDVSQGFIVYTSAVSTNPQLTGSLFDFDNDMFTHYRHGYYTGICSDTSVFQFQVGGNALESSRYSELGGYENIGMSAEGALSWKLGVIPPGGRQTLTMYICAAKTLKSLKLLAKQIKSGETSAYSDRTAEYWHQYLKKAMPVKTGNAELDRLYRRSLLIFGLMTDKSTGGLLAAPEVDEEFTRCGRYAYCWGRDAAFITAALDKSGLTDTVDRFYRWAADTQDEDGSWQQRYHLDGNLAPSWGVQIDETGTILWGIARHYEVTRNKAFLLEMWETVRKGADFLVGFADEETGLPAPSFDLWEERLGEHAYSSAAVWAGIRAAIDISGILGNQGEYIARWEAAANRISAAVGSNFWREPEGRFLRSIRVKTNPWGSENTENKVYIKVNPKGYYRDFTLEDWVPDISLLGLTVPFELYPANDPKIESTARLLEDTLSGSPAGGLKRYENDGYIGGNPWIIATLWAALYYLKRREYRKAKDCLEWAAAARTELDLLPEQADKESGRPAWVIPLTWSHAMYVLVLAGLVDAGVF